MPEFGTYVFAVVIVLVLLIVFALRRLKFGFGGSGRPSVAFLSTGALSREYRDVTLARESIVSDLVPLEENVDIVFVTTTKADLPETVSRLYKSGVRYFVGGVTSTELLSIAPFMNSHRDCVLVTTASTADIRPNIGKNIYRFIPNDVRALPLFVDLLNQERTNFAGGFVILYDEKDSYTIQMSRLLQSKLGCKSFRLGQSGQALKEVENGSSLILLEIDPYRAYNFIVDHGSLLAGKVFVSDIFAFFPFEKAELTRLQSLGVKSFVSWIMHEETYAFGCSIFGQPVSPFISNLLIALWYISDMYFAKTMTMSKAHVEQQKLFDSSGDCNLNHVAMVGVRDGAWDVLSHVSENPYLSRFHSVTRS